MSFKKKSASFLKAVCGVSAISFGLFAGTAVYAQASLPDKLYIPEGEKISFNLPMPIKASGIAVEMPVNIYSKAGNSFQVSLKTLGNAAVKDVNVEVVERKLLIPGGMPFGIKMFTDGVMVVGMSNISTDKGIENPAKLAGIRVGDIITSIDGKKVLLNEQVGEIIAASGGKTVTIDLMRDKTPLQVKLIPVLSSDDKSYKAGIWVRDSSAGIGTMTYIDPKNNNFGGLGHAICDIDTEQIMPLSSGEITNVTITGVKKGENGTPGELKGVFTGGKSTGSLYTNNETGIFGTLYSSPLGGYPIPMAFSNEISSGEATILTTIGGTKPKEYKVVIEKINVGNANTKNIVIRVTDPELLEKAGGIVQGMSGSPVIQNGKLVGAVTHVFVNDPTRGYGIFVENMINSSAATMQSGKLAA
ncbi:MAG: SpoIVB peptidase [Oscillospiraceae bacterium]